ncbi:MAG: hypothetical protein RMM17_03425 [Acidobacteriota bacterium]|nr:hypothetical protein [Blastocatellia bacterium]MDW8411719.1 hypothetical protein [Acidobacteriota bacterium]
MTAHRWMPILGLIFSILSISLFDHRVSSSNVSNSTAPKIDRERTIFDKKRLIIRGENFEPGSFIELRTSNDESISAKGQTKVIDSTTIILEGLKREDFPDGTAVITVRNAAGEAVTEHIAVIPSAIGPSPLTVSDIQTIIGQAVAAAQRFRVAATIAITDREGNVLAIYQMNGANKLVVVKDLGPAGKGLEGLGGPQGFDAKNTNQLVQSVFAAISKAGTGAFLSTQGNAFTTRTAAYIIREHIPPFIRNMPSGPLFGVQISNLGCSDVKLQGLPLGLSGDPGGIPIYKNGRMAGGLGIELNGIYTVALNRPEDLGRKLTESDPLFFQEGLEEIIAFAAVRGYEAPDAITADKILVNGIRLPFRRQFDIPLVTADSFNRLPGKLLPLPGENTPRIRTGVPTEFRDITLRGRPVRVVNRFFPFRGSRTGLSAAEVEQILFQALVEANRVRAAIRRPLEVPAEVNIAVVDFDGNVLGLISTPDAPVFGFDVSSMKARAATTFSRPDAAQLLTTIGLGKYVKRVQDEGLLLNGAYAITSRGIGWMHRPFYPDGIQNDQSSGPGPLSVGPEEFSPLNNGFQTDYLLLGRKDNNPLSIVILRSVLNAMKLAGDPKNNFKDPNFCDASNGRTRTNLFNNGLMIFSGSSLLYKENRLVGAIGISGDGTDQDDIISAFGSEGFEAPPEIRSDRFFMRGVRIPYTKFPRHPHLGEE